MNLALESDQSFLDELNPPQREAVEQVTGPALVLAGAGSGKTRVLTHRVAHLILKHGVAPEHILAVTFTNKAAQEMKHRLGALLGVRAHKLWIATFHSAGLRMLRQTAEHLGYNRDFVVYDDQDSKSLLKEVLTSLNIKPEREIMDECSRAIDKAKNEYMQPQDLAQRAHDLASEQRAAVYDRYQRGLLAANAMDFGDLLMNTVRVLQEFPTILSLYRSRFQYLLVDEFQDTNKVQYLMIKLLAQPRNNLFVVGDDDQSIYAFRGANITNLLNFENDFPGAAVVKLEQNYRSTGNILEVAHSIIVKNSSRKPKKMWTSAEAGEPVCTFIGRDEMAEADFIGSEIAKSVRAGAPYSNVAILYRTNAQTRAIEESLLRMRIPYRIFGGLKFYDRKEIKDILAYLRLVVNPSDNQAFQRVVNTPPRGIGPQTIQQVVEAAARENVNLLEASLRGFAKHKNISQFLTIVAEIKEKAVQMPLAELIGFAVERTEYGPKLRTMNDQQAQSRLENLAELQAAGGRFTSEAETPLDVLRDFLDRACLTAGTDAPTVDSATQDKGSGQGQTQSQAVSLMTLHLAKGLEFPMVFLSGVEEGLLPHYRSLQDKAMLEEERRLCYVGTTRAKQKLYLTRAFVRGMFSSGSALGSSGLVRQVSRFVHDIPQELLRAVGTDRNPDADFIDGFPHETSARLDEQDSAYRSPNRSFMAQGRPTPSLSFDQVKKLLQPAESIPVQKRSVTNYDRSKLATLEDLAPGVSVVHPSFGTGAVVEISGSETNPMVVVQFEEFTELKKLMVQHAKLALL